MISPKTGLTDVIDYDSRKNLKTNMTLEQFTDHAKYGCGSVAIDIRLKYTEHQIYKLG